MKSTVKGLLRFTAFIENLLRLLRDEIYGERSRWILLVPVIYGAGIAAYFSLTLEPQNWIGPTALLVCLVGCVVFRHAHGLLLILVGTAVFWGGFSVVKLRSDAVEASVLLKPVGPATISGRILRIESFSKRPRVLLDRLKWAQKGKARKFPNRILLRLHNVHQLQIGDRIQVLARLLPLPSPVSPGAFDYQRKSWFDRIGGTGYAVGRFLKIEPVKPAQPFERISLGITKMRHELALRIHRQLGSSDGPIVIALITGDRSRIPEHVTQNMRDSGLAHLLAISGLHIGLVATLVFAIVRFLLATVPFVALRLDTKRWAAVGALAASFFYLLISGATLPTQRAFIMGAMILAAVFWRREAISLRMVALAAVVVLTLTPESLLSASFQMSFAAVTALVAFYESSAPWFRKFSGPRNTWRSRIILYFLALLATTVVAGISTGIVAYYHFGRVTHYGVIANILAVPITALWIMPSAVLSGLLMTIGQEIWGLQLMGAGVSVVLYIAREVAGWAGAVTLLPTLPTTLYVISILGGLWLCLMTRMWRFGGVFLIAGGLLSAPFIPRPDILISESGGLYAVRLPDGEYSFSQAKSERFSAEKWMQNNGQVEMRQWSENESFGPRCDSIGCLYRRGVHQVAFVRHASALGEDCATATLVLTNLWRRRVCEGRAGLVSRRDLSRDGAHAIYLHEREFTVISVSDVRGSRPWSGRQSARP